MKNEMINVIRGEERHLSGIAELERLCFANPWTEDGLLMLTSDNGLAAVIEEDGDVLAYGGVLFAADEAEITDVATCPDRRRCGYGRAIMEWLISESISRGAVRMSLEVRASNEAAIELYKSLGFEIMGKRPRFYRNPTEDAYVMLLMLVDEQG